MYLFMLWVSVHKNIAYGVLALGLWALAQYSYFKYDLRNIRRRRRPHVWAVDMKSKTVTKGPSSVQ